MNRVDSIDESKVGTKVPLGKNMALLEFADVEDAEKCRLIRVTVLGRGLKRGAILRMSAQAKAKLVKKVSAILGMGDSKEG